MSQTALVDLSHEIYDGLVTYRGLPAPAVTDFLSREASAAKYAAGVTFHIARLTMVANTGTYVDAPSHRWEAGADLAGLPLARLADLEAVVVHWPFEKGRAIGPETLDGSDVAGRAVLFHTGWDRHWDTPEYPDGAPFVSAAAADRLVASGALLAGIDSFNIDDTGDLARPVHSALLRAGIPVVEHLTNLGALPARGARFFAVPPRVRGMGTFPVRAFAVVPAA